MSRASMFVLSCTDTMSGISVDLASPGEKKEDDFRNRLVKVVERLSILAKAANLRRIHSLTSDNSASNEIVTTCNRQRPADLIQRYCSKCEFTVADVSISIPQLCAKCGAILNFQCTRCDKLYNNYGSIFQHLESICNRQNLDLQCPKCNYQTHSKNLMKKHLNRCTSGIIYSCNRCKYTTNRKSDFYSHRQRHLKDNDIKAHGDLVAIRDISDKADEKEKDNMLITTGGRQKPADLIRRYCSKCKLTVAVVCVTTTHLCTKCGTLLEFQCIRCDKLYSRYQSILNHFESACNRRKLDLSCPKCDYRTPVTKSMKEHLKYCASEIIHRCSHCEYKTKYRSNLYKHMRRIHEDICHAACSKCGGEPNKCHRCKNIRLICENCHVGFGSNERLQEHYESCKK